MPHNNATDVRLLSCRQVARTIGVPASTVRKWLRTGVLPLQVIRLGNPPRWIRVREDELQRFLEDGGPNAEA